MASETPLKVAVLDDHPLFRRGVVELLNDSEKMVVVAEYDAPEKLLTELSQLSLDLLLLDLQIPTMSGLEVLSEIRQLNETLAVVIMTADADQEKMVKAVQLGANGYLQKDTQPDVILHQLLAAVSGQVVLNDQAVTSIAHHLRRSHAEAPSRKDTIADFTERETETLRFIANGMNNKLIARQLGISDGTVKVYVKNLLRKLSMHSRLELAAWAHKNLSDEELSESC